MEFVRKGTTLSPVRSGERAQVLVQTRAGCKLAEVRVDAGASVVQINVARDRVQPDAIDTLPRIAKGRGVIAIVENQSGEERLLDADFVFVDEDEADLSAGDANLEKNESALSALAVVEGGEARATADMNGTEVQPMRDASPAAIAGLDLAPQIRDFQSSTPSDTPAQSMALLPQGTRVTVLLLRAHAGDLHRFVADRIPLPHAVESAIAWQLSGDVSGAAAPSDGEVALRLDVSDASAIVDSLLRRSEPLAAVLDRDAAFSTRLRTAVAVALDLEPLAIAPSSALETSTPTVTEALA